MYQNLNLYLYVDTFYVAFFLDSHILKAKTNYVLFYYFYFIFLNNFFLTASLVTPLPWDSNKTNHKWKCWHIFTVNIAGVPNRHIIYGFWFCSFWLLTVFSSAFYWIQHVREAQRLTYKFSWLPVILQLSRASSEKSLPISDCIWLSVSASTLICCFPQACCLWM